LEAVSLKTGRLTAGMTNIAVAYATATKMGLCPKPQFLFENKNVLTPAVQNRELMPSNPIKFGKE